MTHSTTHPSLAWIEQELQTLQRQGLRRQLISRESAQAATVRVDGRELVNFAANDYLGLAADPRLAHAALEATRNHGWGSGASPLITGHSRNHDLLEQQLAAFEGTEAALVFPSGFAANAGTIAALAGPGDVVFSDRLNHASLWDGCRLSRADVRAYPHGDLNRLERLLRRSTDHRRRLIVSDSLFSMDGDCAALADLADLAERFDAMLLVDEAHATGVFGPFGRGVGEEAGVEGRIPVRVGTLSKALGCVGGFVAGSRTLIEWLVNRARPYIFSTAGPSANAAAAIAALRIVREEPQRRMTLLARAAALRKALAAQGWNLGTTSSQIIPVIVGEPDRAVALAAGLRAEGLFVPAIRPPTVPDGTARLRISLSHSHSPSQIARLVDALGEFAEGSRSG